LIPDPFHSSASLLVESAGVNNLKEFVLLSIVNPVESTRQPVSFNIESCNSDKMYYGQFVGRTIKNLKV